MPNQIAQRLRNGRGTRRMSIAVSSLIVLSLIVATAMLTVSCQQQSGSGAVSAETARERIMRTGVIKAGYAVYPPASIKDPNTGTLSGIFIDVLEEAAKNLELEVEWTEEVAWGTMIEGLNSCRYDIIGSGVWANSSRAREADFTIPIYFNWIGAYVRAEDDRFNKGISSLMQAGSSLTIATIDGEMSDLIAKTDYPEAKTSALPQMSEGSQLLLEVATRKADVTFVQPFTANQYESANPGSLKNIASDRPVRVFPTVFMIKADEYDFKRTLDVAIEELVNSGFVDRTIEKYAQGDSSFYRPADSYRLPE